MHKTIKRAQQIGQSTQAIVQKYTLPNGIRLVSEAIPSVRSVSVGVWVFSGSRDEALEESGISHFIEHMVFKGTRRRRMRHIAQRMEAVGGYLNAFTSKEYTCYYARCLDEHLGRALDTLGDLVFQPLFPLKEIDKEKDVVLEEMKMYEDAPDEHIFDRFEEIIYPEHALGRPVIGYSNSVKSLTQQKLFSFFEHHYSPNRIVIAVSGNVDHQKAIKLTQKSFGEEKRAHSDRTREPATQHKPLHAELYRPINQAHFVLGTRSYNVYDRKRIPLTVLNTILGGGMSSRLNQHIREKYGFCYNIYSFINMHQDTGDFGVYMGTDPSKVKRAQKLIFRELHKLQQQPVSSRMLSLAKSQVKGSIMLGLESMSNRMMRIGRQELYYGRFHSLDQILEDIDNVTAADVQNVAQELFDPERFSSVVLLPTD